MDTQTATGAPPTDPPTRPNVIPGDTVSGDDFLLSGAERHRIEFDNGHWVEILPHVTHGMRQSWMKAASSTKTKIKFQGRGRKTKQEGEADVNVDAEVLMSRMLNDLVKAWSSPQPVTPENIAKMPEWMCDRVKAEFERLNPGVDDEEDDEAGD